MTTVTLTGLRTVNSLNRREHWAARAKRTKHQRRIARWTLAPKLNPARAWLSIGGHVTLEVTRIAPSSGLDPHDGLPASLKAVVDGVCDALDLKSDRDPALRISYAQARGPYAVRVEVHCCDNRPQPAVPFA